jgi:DNA-binding response OmpR family regulator
MSDAMNEELLSILVVEDDPLVSQQLLQLIELWGYRMYSAPTGEAALLDIKRVRPDIILTDLMLPGISGMAVIQYAQKVAAQTPVLIMTAHASMDGAIDALKQGAYDYLLKPITPPELRAALDRARASVDLARTRAHAQQIHHIAEVALTLAHEINNPLAMITGELQLRIETGSLDEEERRTIDVCLQAAQRIAATIRKLTALQDISYEQYGPMRLINLAQERE